MGACVRVERSEPYSLCHAVHCHSPVDRGSITSISFFLGYTDKASKAWYRRLRQAHNNTKISSMQ